MTYQLLIQNERFSVRNKIKTRQKLVIISLLQNLLVNMQVKFAI